MSFKWIDFLELAEMLANPGKTKITQAYYRSSLSRAYYAVYWISREHATKNGLGIPREDPHKVVREFYLNSSDPSHKEIGEDLKRLWKNRKDADYEKKREFSPSEAIWNSTAAKLAVEKLRKIGAQIA